MKQVGDWFVPDHMKTAGNHVRRSAAIEAAMSYLPTDRREIAVQAGGHIGIWPKRLSEYFKYVFTWEPMWENFQCLIPNCGDIPNVFAKQGCLGDTNTTLHMVYSPKNTGKHYVTQRNTEHETTVERLDDVEKVYRLDALFLDVEGYELSVLKGAQRLISEFKPLILTEQNGLASRFGVKDFEIDGWLMQYGYSRAERWEEDIIYVPEAWR